MLWRDSSLTPEKALEELQTARPFVGPNDGFMRQLHLYHSIGCPVDVLEEPAYQRWLYQREVQLSVDCGRAPDHIRFEDEEAPKETSSSAQSQPDFRCRRCRQKLASSQYIITHTPKPPSATQAAQLAPLDSVPSSSASIPPQCAHIFFDPLSWMRPELEKGMLSGKLNCPNAKCNSNVGKYAWQGQRCSCGQWVVPAISLSRSRIDEIRPLAVHSRQGKM